MSVFSFHNNIKHELLGYLYAAKKSVYAAIAWFTDEDIFRILCNKSVSGCEIIIILRDDFGMNDSINFSPKGLQFSKLIFAGGRIFTAYDLHNKYCIIDNKIYISGSYNWTNAAAYRNNGFENIDVFIDDSKATEMVKIFNRLMGESVPILEHLKVYPLPNIALERCEISDFVELDKSIYRCRLTYEHGYQCYVYLPTVVNDYLSSALNNTDASLALKSNEKAYFSNDLKLTIYQNMLWLDLKETTIQKNIQERTANMVRKALSKKN